MVTRRDLPDGEAPELIPYRTMKVQYSHMGGGVFVAEGDKLVHRLTRLLSGAGRGAATGIVGRPALGPRADEVLLVMMPPGRCSFLFEQAGQEQQRKRIGRGDSP